MNIIVNGSPRDVPDELSAGELIGALGLGNRRLALEVNEAIVPRSRFDSYHLQPGDRVEIVHAIGGG
jgi:sulfur carrier protein